MKVGFLQFLGSFQVLLCGVLFIATFTLCMNWLKDNPLVRSHDSKARAISVGLPLDLSFRQRPSRTEIVESVSVPEADRKVHRQPLYFIRRAAIQAIPVVDADGSETNSKADKMEGFAQPVCIAELTDLGAVNETKLLKAPVGELLPF